MTGTIVAISRSVLRVHAPARPQRRQWTPGSLAYPQKTRRLRLAVGQQTLAVKGRPRSAGGRRTRARPAQLRHSWHNEVQRDGEWSPGFTSCPHCAQDLCEGAFGHGSCFVSVAARPTPPSGTASVRGMSRVGAVTDTTTAVASPTYGPHRGMPPSSGGPRPAAAPATLSTAAARLAPPTRRPKQPGPPPAWAR